MAFIFGVLKGLQVLGLGFGVSGLPSSFRVCGVVPGVAGPAASQVASGVQHPRRRKA